MQGQRDVKLDSSIVEFINSTETFWLQDCLDKFSEDGRSRSRDVLIYNKLRKVQLTGKIQCCTIGKEGSYRKNERKFLVVEKITELDLK